MAEMKDSTAMAQGQKARSRSDILREHCNCLHSLLSLDSIDLKDVGKDDEINRVVFLGDYCEDAWAAIKIVAPLCDAQELVDSLQPVMKERERLRRDGLSLHEYYMSLCRTSDDFVIQEGGVYSVHEDLDRSVWEEFQATIGDYTPRFPSWLSWERDQVGNNLSGILSALRKTVSQAMMILELWLLPAKDEDERSIPESDPNTKAAFSGAELLPSQRKAFSSYEWVSKNHPGLVPGDGSRKRYTRAMYDKAIEESGFYDGKKKPSFESWKSYVRTAERAIEGAKNTPRAGRGHGSSIVGPDQI